MTSPFLPLGRRVGVRRRVGARRRAARLVGLLVVVCGVAVPVAGCGEASSRSGAGGDTDPAALLPASAPVYVEAQVRPSGQMAVNLDAVAGKVLGTSDPGAKVVGWIDGALEGSGASYAKDVAPWLGARAGVAVMSVGGGGGAGGSPRDVDVVGAVASRDDDAAQKFVDGRRGAVDREYRGVKYTYDAGRDVAAAVIDHAVVVGTERGFKSAVDAQSGAKLADSASFKKARATVGTAGAGFAYADPARFFDMVAGAAAGGSGKLSQGSASASSLQMLKGLLAGSGLESVAASLNVAKDALQVDAAAIGVKAPVGRGDGDGPAAAAAVPAGAWLSVGIGDVGSTLATALQGVRGGAGIDPSVLLKSLGSQFGIDVQKDLLSWMGDAALFVRGTSMSSLNGALVVTSKDPAASAAAIPKLRTLLKSLNVKVGELSSSAPSGALGFSIDAGSSVPSKIEVATKDDKFAIAIGPGALHDALAPPSHLSDSDPFRAAASLLGDTKPSIFLDTPQVVKLLSSLAGNNKHFQNARPALEAFGPAAAGLSSSGDVTRLKAAVSVP
ncbi:MAG TPA: DUF3352 domain-containing protein [Baekduia sp.]